MKRFSSITVVAIASVCLAAGAAQPQHPGSAAREQGAASAHAPAQPGPANVKVEFEKRQGGRAARSHGGARAHALATTSPLRVVVWLTPVAAQGTSADGRAPACCADLPGRPNGVRAAARGRKTSGTHRMNCGRVSCGAGAAD